MSLSMKWLLTLLALTGFSLRINPNHELWLRHEYRDCHGNTIISYLVGIGKEGVMWLGKP